MHFSSADRVCTSVLSKSKKMTSISRKTCCWLSGDERWTGVDIACSIATVVLSNNRKVVVVVVVEC